MNPSAEELRGQGYDITVYAGDSITLDEEIDQLYDYLDKVSECDFIFINVHGDVSYFRHWSNLKKVIDKNNVSALVSGVEEAVALQYRDMFRQSDEDYLRLRWRATYSPWGRKESDMTEQITLTSKHQKI